jgi:hypothetical protein
MARPSGTGEGGSCRQAVIGGGLVREPVELADRRIPRDLFVEAGGIEASNQARKAASSSRRSRATASSMP